MKKKTLFIMIFAVLAVVFAVTLTIALAENNPTLSADTVQAQPGETVSVDLKIKNNPGITAICVYASYDSETLELVEKPTNGVIFTGAQTIFSQQLTANPYMMVWAHGTEDFTGDGVLATMKFKVSEDAKAGTYPIALTVDAENTYNTEWQEFEFETVQGIITVNAPVYVVTFKDGLTGEVFATTEVEKGGNATMPTVPVHEGYTFTGWDKDGKNIVEDTTITALYAQNEYTVTFVDGLTHETISTATVKHGADAALPTPPEHAGYRFTGWDKDGKNITADTTITAEYVIDDENAPTITADAVNAKPGETVSVNVYIKNNPGITAICVFAEFDHTVLSLTDKPVNGNIFTGAQMIFSQDISTNPYKMVWAHGTEDFDTDGILCTMTFKVDENAEAGTYRINFTVDSENTYNTEWTEYKFATEAGSITVQPDSTTYTVTFMNGHTNEVISTVTVEEGNDVTFPEVPTYEGYTFTGWDNDGKNITADTTITAQYAINTYTVTFKDGLTGDTISTATVEHGKDATLPTAPTHEGYTFTDWDNDGKNITADITITAQYELAVVIGDLNGDGKINTADAVIILKIAAGMIAQDENNTIAGDCNHDGKVNTADAVLILKYAAGMITEF